MLNNSKIRKNLVVKKGFFHNISTFQKNPSRHFPEIELFDQEKFLEKRYFRIFFQYEILRKIRNFRQLFSRI